MTSGLSRTDGVDPITAEATAWFVRLHENPSDTEVQPAFEEWRSADPRHASAYARLQRLWGASGHLPSLALPERCTDRRTILRASIGMGFAAVSLFAGGRMMLGPHPLADYRTRAGERSTIMLADGSIVELSTSSALSVDLSSDRRKLKLLEGEAWFQVARDAERPFIVETTGSSITARGTAFAVACEDDATRVTVTEHVVDVEVKGHHAAVREGQSLVYGAGRFGPPVPADPATLAWRKGRLEFVNLPFGRVVAALDRWTGTTTLVLDTTLSARPVTLISDVHKASEGLAELSRLIDFQITKVGLGLTIIRPT